MVEIFFFILGAVISGISVWFITSSNSKGKILTDELRKQIDEKEGELVQLREKNDKEKESRIRTETNLESSQKNLEDQKVYLEKVKKDMTDTFTALSKKALESNNENFSLLASGKLGEHKEAINGLIKPLQESLKRYEEHVNSMEKNGREVYGSLQEQIKNLASGNEQLQKETGNLVSALRKPQVRGKWGEITLIRVAELAGMTKYCNFEEQVSVSTESGRLRPDMIVHLPMSRQIVVDAKVPLEAYLDAINSQTEEDRINKMKDHAGRIKAHIKQLSSKEYWNQFSESPQFVVLFIPGECFFSAAVEIDNTLIEEGIQKKVLIATPTTFIAILKGVASGWRQEQIAENVKKVSDIGRELYGRMNVLAEHFGKIGVNLEKTVKEYNQVVGSMESRLLPAIRKFKELGVVGDGDKEIPVLEQIDQSPRDINSSLFQSTNDQSDGNA